MKIYTKIEWDKDGNVLEEDSFEYDGPVVLLKGNPPAPPPPPPPPPTRTSVEPVRSKGLGRVGRGRRSRGRGALVTKRGTPLGVESSATGESRTLIGVIKTLVDKLGVQ